MNNPISTDLELAAALSKEVAEHYREGVEFVTALPQHSLVQFRCALEALCELLATAHGLKLTSADLRRNIDVLLDGRAITFALKDSLHSIRQKCNPAAHKPERADNINEQREANALRREALLRDAALAREALVSAMQQIHKDLHQTSQVLDVLRVEIKTQEWKDLLFEAVTNEDAAGKYRAGLWCEAHIDELIDSITSLVVSDEFDAQIKFLKRFAASLYKASDAIKPNLDARFRYASFVERDLIDGEKKQEAIETIRKAADAGHGAACDLYACILFDDHKDYEASQQYWEKAINLGVARAYYCLGTLYLADDFSGKDPLKAINFYRKGVEEEDAYSYYGLGICYFDGSGVEKNIDESRALLSKAIELGLYRAKQYLAMYVNGGIDRICDEFQKIGIAMQIAMAQSQPASKRKRPRPNDPCSCGADKKFKRCCGLKLA